LIYLPDLNQYISPNFAAYRTPLFSHILANNYGLFISEVSVGKVHTPISETKYIEPVPIEYSQNNIDCKVEISDSPYDSKVTLINETSGYAAYGNQFIYSQIDDEEKEEFKIERASYYVDKSEINDVSVSNMDVNESSYVPMITKMNFNLSPFLEKAGNQYLLKVGELIGPQIEMYDENKERIFSTDHRYKMQYNRIIEIKFPEDYDVKGLDAIAMDHRSKVDGTEAAKFVSTYKWADDHTLLITINETYDQVVFPTESFESYKSVINAAADFNKIILVMKPKS